MNNTNTEQLIKQLSDKLIFLENKILSLESRQVSINSNPEMVKHLLNITKEQIVVDSIAILPTNSPVGTIAMQGGATPKLSFKSATGWVTLI